MNPAGKKVLGLIVFVVVLVSIIVAWHFAHRPKNPIVNTNDNRVHLSTQNVGDSISFSRTWLIAC